MNERLMHATIALAARCAEHDRRITSQAAGVIAHKLAELHDLDVNEREALCRAAAAFAAPLDQARPSTAATDAQDQPVSYGAVIHMRTSAAGQDARRMLVDEAQSPTAA